MHAFATNYQFDVLGLPESGLHWPAVSTYWQFQERMFRLFGSTFSGVTGWNQHFRPKDIRLWGGVSQIALGKAKHKYAGCGTDPRKLGRWVWQKFRGHGNRILRVVTTYRPCNKNTSTGTENVWSQQRTFFTAEGTYDRDPRHAILADLKQEVDKWHGEGDLVIVMGDFNEDIQSAPIKTPMAAMGLREVITERHHNSAPGTRLGGSKPIDGIFASWALDIEIGGYTGDESIQGNRADHRCLWIDVRIDNVFGVNIADSQPRIRSRCNCKDPRVIRRFNTAYEQHINTHRLDQRMFRLEHLATYPLSLAMQQEAEKIDNLKQQGIAHADKKCRSLFMGTLVWTPLLSQLLSKQKFWAYLDLQKQGRKVKDTTLLRLLRHSHEDRRLHLLKALSPDDRAAERTTVKAAIHAYSQDEKGHHKRRSWQSTLAEARVTFHEEHQRKPHTRTKRQLKMKTTDQKNSAEILQMQRTEQIRRVFRRIHRATGKRRTEGLTKVLVPQLDDQGHTTWKEVSSKEEVEDACIQENIRRFTQAQHCPLNQGSLRLLLGLNGTGPASQEVLNGSFQPRPDVTIHTRLLLQGLRRQGNGDNIEPPGIPTKDYIKGWRRMKENTGAAPTGPTFSQCKAGTYSPKIAEFEASYSSLPWQTGYVYRRWKRGVDVELPKKAGEYKTTKLRTIVLLDSQFNFGNKYLAKKIAFHAEQRGSMAPEQYGSRKKHRAIAHALNKRLTFDLSRQLRWPLALCPNDLTSCYDRINHVGGSLAMQSQGASETEVLCMFDTLQECEHTIRTAYGDSNKSYGRQLWTVPVPREKMEVLDTIGSIYQGNGSGPVLWAVVSSPMLRTLKEQGFGTFFKTSMSTETIRLVGYAFVDDFDLVQSGLTVHEPWQHTAAHMQRSMDLWEGLVHASGGALNLDPTKSTWYLVAFEWNADGSWRYGTIDECPAVLQARDVDGTIKAINRLAVDAPFTTLGVILTPNGDQTAGLEYLHMIAAKWADAIRVSGLRHHEANEALTKTILKSLEYPLPALTLSKEQCGKVMSTILKAGLPKAGIVRTFQRETLYGPTGHIGLALHDLFTTMVISHADMLLHHGPSQTPTGSLLRATIQAAKVEMGLPGPLFEQPRSLRNLLLTDSWIKEVVNEFASTQLRFQDGEPDLELRRVGDRFIMQGFVDASVTGQDLVKLQRCCQFMKVTTLSDMTTGDGRHLLPGVLNGNLPPVGLSPYGYPHQGPLPNSTWHLWKSTVTRTFLQLRHSSRLAEPLGDWLTPISPSSWHSFWSPQTNLVYIKQGTQWMAYHRLLTAQRHPTTHEHLPADAIPTVSWVVNHQVRFTGTALTQVRPAPRSLAEALQAFPAHSRWTLALLRRDHDLGSLLQDIRTGTAIAVADGSFKNGRSTSGFTLRQANSERGITGANLVPGRPEVQCSYRSELAGILGILTVLQLLHSTYDLTGSAITIACDNLTAGQKSFESEGPIQPNQDQHDILRLIRLHTEALPIKLRYLHVEGHQAEKYPGRPLDRWAQVNNEMDTLAKAFWHHTQQDPLPPEALTPQEWAIWTPEGKLSSKIASLRRYITGTQLEKVWQQKKRFSRAQIDLIDSRSIAKAMKRQPVHRRRFLAKFTSNQGPTGKNMERWRFWTTSKCPRCGIPNEDSHHVLDCQHPTTLEAKAAATLEWEEAMHANWTSGPVLNGLQAIVQHVLFRTAVPAPSQFPPHVRTAMQAQHSIGWDHLLHGRLAKAWKIAQIHDWDSATAAKYANRWSHQSIHLLWQLTWTLWDHRNAVLKSPEGQDRLHNMTTIDQEIRDQWSQGTGSVHAMDRRLWNAPTVDTILHRDSIQRRQWLQAVHLARLNPLSDASDDEH